MIFQKFLLLGIFAELPPRLTLGEENLFCEQMIHALHDLLLEFGRASSKDARQKISDDIWTGFGVDCSVLVWDMSGFSLVARRHGIVHYLSMVRRMQETSKPIIEEHLGLMVKFEADNGFAVFADTEAAIRASLAINQALKADNARFPSEFEIRISSGIDHGSILLAAGQDFYGDAVNTASKLGEDLAEPGEILVSSEAFELVPNQASFRAKPVNFSISGLELEAVSVESASEAGD